MREATLTDVLAARDRRVETQQMLLQKHNLPVICFTLNVAGPIKVDDWTEYAFAEGCDRLLAGLDSMHFPIAGRAENASVAGRELLLSVDAPAEQIKDLCVTLEALDPLGRLFDMDVLTPDGEKLARGEERCCLVCGKPGRGCASRRIHPLAELQRVTREIIRAHWLNAEKERIASLAVQSLLDEVCTTPKPGLVDCANTGSHSDMDIFTFNASASALGAYFGRCFLAGAQNKALAPETAFAALRGLGLDAERAMLRATGGVNTHKGAIFTLGLLCASAGKTLPDTPASPLPDADTLLAACAEMAKTHAQPVQTERTNGEKAHARYGIGGVREEAASGFPSLRKFGLPALQKARSAGLSPNDSNILVLLHLIATVQDTNMVARGGIAKAEQARETTRALLAQANGLLPEKEQLVALDAAFIREHLSPGGCADLLAATLFLSRCAKI